MKAPRPVFVVDDEKQVLDSVRCLLLTDKHDVHCYQNAKDFLNEITPDQVGCLITDLGMPEIDGFELQERLMAMRSLLSVIIVTGKADVHSAVRLMKNGAITLLEKPYPPEDLLDEVQHSLEVSQRRGEIRRLRDTARRLLQLLVDEERQVMKLAAEGLPNKAIAQRLTMSARTVDRRRQSAQNKLGINSPSGFTKLLADANEDDWDIESIDRQIRKKKLMKEDDEDDDTQPLGAVVA